MLGNYEDGSGDVDSTDVCTMKVPSEASGRSSVSPFFRNQRKYELEVV